MRIHGTRESIVAVCFAFSLAAAMPLAFAAKGDSNRYSLRGSPYSFDLPPNWVADRHGARVSVDDPGISEGQVRWTLREIYCEQDRPDVPGISIPLSDGWLVVDYYPKGTRLSTVEVYINMKSGHKAWGEPEWGRWQGLRTYSEGRKWFYDDFKKENPWVTLAYLIEEPAGTLIVEMSCPEPRFRDLVSFFSDLKGSIRRGKAPQAKGAKPPESPRIFLKNEGDPMKPYKIVSKCPAGLKPVVKDWPFKGDMLCE